jgi:hypothetical protein
MVDRFAVSVCVVAYLPLTAATQPLTPGGKTVDTIYQDILCLPIDQVASRCYIIHRAVVARVSGKSWPGRDRLSALP